MLKTHKFISLVLMLVVSKICCCQYTDLGSWNIVNLKYKIAEKWSVFGEAQLRSLRFYDDFHYHEYKAGLNYKIHPYATRSGQVHSL